MKILRIILLVAGITLIIGWFLFKTVAAVIPLTKLILPLIILGAVIGVWIKFTEKVKNFFKVLAGIDLVKRLFQTSLLIIVYIIWFYFSYSILPPILSKISKLSYAHTLIGINFLQVFAAGAGYYLLSSIWKETGKIARAFWIISIVGSITIAYYHPDTRPVLINFVKGFWQENEVIAKSPSRPLSGTFEIPAGKGLWKDSPLLMVEGDKIWLKSISESPAVAWDNKGKRKIKIPMVRPTKRPCNKDGPLWFVKQKQTTEVAFRIKPK